MATEIIEMGTISSRGQIAIPSDIRERLDLEEGSRVLFVVENDTLLMKKVSSETFRDITKPLKEAARKAGFKESETINIVHKSRKK